MYRFWPICIPLIWDNVYLPNLAKPYSHQQLWLNLGRHVSIYPIQISVFPIHIGYMKYHIAANSAFFELPTLSCSQNTNRIRDTYYSAKHISSSSKHISFSSKHISYTYSGDKEK